MKAAVIILSIIVVVLVVLVILGIKWMTDMVKWK